MDASTKEIPVRAPAGMLGIYFNLPKEVYLADDALGSGDIKRLRTNPTSYWHNSPMNPRRVCKKADYFEHGTAMHTMLLEGDGAFAAQYMRGAEHTEDMTPAEKGALTKEANKKAATLGMTALPAADFDRVLEARVIIKMNPHLTTVFENGFSEVSIFWMRDGVRRKARIDYLKIRGIGDLKSAANPYEIDFEECARRAIANHRYDIQAAHYLEARSMIRPAFAAGLVFGEHDQDLLKKVANTDGIGWQWVFFCTDGAADACSYNLVHGNPMIEGAQRDIEIAISRYVKLKAKFGNKQWTLIKSPQHLTYELMPAYFARTTAEEMDEYEAWMQSKGTR